MMAGQEAISNKVASGQKSQKVKRLFSTHPSVEDNLRFTVTDKLCGVLWVKGNECLQDKMYHI